MANPWWIYQKERFPVIAHGVLIATFSFSAVSFSALLRGSSTLPACPVFLVAFANSFLSFLQLRIADEFKDFEEDSQFRPYRPVPRGLVKLRELGWIGAGTGVLQALMAIWLQPRLLPLLLLNWTYLAMMSREFFAREWLKARPITYLWSHMLIMPLIDFYATACDWTTSSGIPPEGLFWFVIVSFFNGVVIEIGRKIRSPEKEEKGVQTYSVLWGGKTASLTWLSLMALTALAAISAAGLIRFRFPSIIMLSIGWAAALFLVAGYIRTRQHAWAKWFEPLSGLWTILLYLTLGSIPMILRAVIQKS